MSFRHIYQALKRNRMGKNMSITCRREREKKMEIDREAEICSDCRQTLSVPRGPEVTEAGLYF